MNELLRIINFVLENLSKVWPILLITIPISLMIKHFDTQKRIEKLLSSHWLISVLIATAVGAIAPFCSCSVIPVIAGLIAAGVPIAPIMSFWLASPSMDPEIFLLSTASIGFNLALARLLATGLMSFFGGVISHYLIDLKRHKNNGFYTKKDSPTLKGKERNQLILKEGLETLFHLLKFLVLAYTLEAIIVFYIPASWISNFFGQGPLGILKATFISIPMYTTNLSALGLISGLLTKGLSEGAALAFLIGGATTTIPAMAAVYKIVERKIFLFYIFLASSSAFLSGLIFDLIL